MSLPFIRSNCFISIYKGMTVYVNGNKGTVEGAKGILIKIRMEETNEVLLFHPHNTKIHTEDGCEISMPQQLELFSEVS